MKYSKDSRQSINNIKESLADKDIDMFQETSEIARQTGSLNDMYFRIAVHELQIELTRT